MPPIRCTAQPSVIGSRTVVRLPKAASAKLPSRGMAMAEGTLDGKRFVFVLEPDGKGSHWFALDAAAGEALELAMEPMERWTEPDVPPDLKKALAADAKARAIWEATTPAARWDWIRWVRSTKNLETRANRIEVACSKMRAGERRPCCFNRSMCTDPEVSKGGVLVEG